MQVCVSQLVIRGDQRNASIAARHGVDDGLVFGLRCTKSMPLLPHIGIELPKGTAVKGHCRNAGHAEHGCSRRRISSVAAIARIRTPQRGCQHQRVQLAHQFGGHGLGAMKARAAEEQMQTFMQLFFLSSLCQRVAAADRICGSVSMARLKNSPTSTAVAPGKVVDQQTKQGGFHVPTTHKAAAAAAFAITLS